ncbi:UNVERIFIED_CONTAM: F-box/kelch-repeat protein [Sesamum calycinum]|uniref:F-box/kelch-repeat protein n=1 Tax=Sesamum calycinum TaxID=2727403 RepID=A0AAW2T091_9LAMI
MAAETSWVSHCFENFASGSVDFDSFSDLNDETDKEAAAVSMDLILPDDLLERILSYLPIASIFRASCVCKRWHEIVKSDRFLWNSSHVSSQKPWYFMFTSSDEPVGYAYDPVLRKWYGIDLPCIETSNWFIASSSGALAVSVNRATHSYNVSIVKSKQVPGNFFQWDLSIHLYDSETMTWVTTLTEVLTGWRAGDESVVCNGVLYFLIYSAGGGARDNRHGLIMYNLRSRSPHGVLMRSFIPVPCSLTCGRLMNLKEKLIMVGGIGKHERPDIIKGIGIWLLKGREWQEIARMPHRYFQGFGEFDDVFASSGTDDLIYIQSYGAPALLVFDVNQKQWKWSQKCPVTKRFPLQLFTGFCFEPRLEIAP